MILSDNEIKDRIYNYKEYNEKYSGRECKKLIENFEEKNLQSASYDITLTNTIERITDSNIKIQLNKKQDIENLFEKVEINDSYELQPNEYILIQINEKINMPDDLVGDVRPRSTLTRLGLILSGQHINPSYSGKLQLGLYNCTPRTILITPNIKVGQIVFEKLDGQANEKNLYYCNNSSKYKNENDFTISKIYEEVSEN